MIRLSKSLELTKSVKFKKTTTTFVYFDKNNQVTFKQKD